MESPTLAPPILDPDEASAPTPRAAPGLQRTSRLAIASLICSLTCIGWIPGIICGHLARHKIRHDPTFKGKRLATAGLIIGYATVLFSVGLAVYVGAWFSTKFKAAYQEAHVFVVTNSPVSSPTLTLTNVNESESQSGNGAGWTMDVKDATVPDNPVSGEVHGVDFQIKRALFRNGNLRFISADGQESLMIHDLGESIENRTMEFQLASGNDAPKIEIAWKEDEQNKSETYPDGYAMELKIGAAHGRKIPGQIYLCLPDDSKSYIAGTFTITLPKPKPKTQPAQ
jgi:hypothetical protein